MAWNWWMSVSQGWASLVIPDLCTGSLGLPSDSSPWTSKHMMTWNPWGLPCSCLWFHRMGSKGSFACTILQCLCQGQFGVAGRRGGVWVIKGLSNSGFWKKTIKIFKKQANKPKSMMDMRVPWSLWPMFNVCDLLVVLWCCRTLLGRKKGAD